MTIHDGSVPQVRDRPLVANLGYTADTIQTSGAIFCAALDGAREIYFLIFP
jgi:hypothetical protein